MQTAKGNSSTKKGPAFTWKRYMRIERLVRLELSGHTIDEMAFHQGVSKTRISQLKSTPEYIAIRTQVATGVVSEADRNMLADIDANHALVKDMVPEALLAVRDAILDRNNPALRLKAAQDLLDREGTLAKVSKSEIKTKVEFDYEQHDQVSTSLLDALRSTELQRPSQDMNGNVDNEDDFIDIFGHAGADKEQQKNLQKAYDLIDAVDMSGQKKDEKPPTIN